MSPVPRWTADDGAGMGGAFQLVSAPSTATHNSTYLHVPRHRERLGEPLAWLHPKDAAGEGITDGDPVVLSSEHGELTLTARLHGDVPRTHVRVDGFVNEELVPEGTCVNALVSPKTSDLGTATCSTARGSACGAGDRPASTERVKAGIRPAGNFAHFRPPDAPSGGAPRRGRRGAEVGKIARRPDSHFHTHCPDPLPMLDLGLNHKTILVTGASGGIGWATAEALGEAGATVLLHGHSRAADLGARAKALPWAERAM